MVRYVPQVSMARILDRIPTSNQFISLKLDSVHEAVLLNQLSPVKSLWVLGDAGRYVPIRRDSSTLVDMYGYETPSEA